MLRCCKTLSIYLGGYESRCVYERIYALSEMLSDKYVVTIKKDMRLPHWSHVFEHDGSYKVWDVHDNCSCDTKEMQKFELDPYCKLILKCQMGSDYPDKFRPFFYFSRGSKRFDDKIDDLRKLPQNKNKLYWRGKLIWQRKTGAVHSRGNRKEIVESIHHLLNENYHSGRNKNVYYREMAQYQMALSLPGIGKACHREFEAFAVGTPVLMPEYTNVYHVNLIPDHHYISVSPHDGESMAEAIERRYWDVRDDEDLLRFVAENAMKYYDAYCRFDASVKWLRELLEL